MNLDGRSALVTGASQGLGRAIAEAYVRAGAHVLLTARGAAALEQTCDDLAALARPGQRAVTLTRAPRFTRRHMIITATLRDARATARL